jgi:tetratricopeptide (TPR) repeat protein
MSGVAGNQISPPAPDDDAALVDALLGKGLCAKAEGHLRQAGLDYDQTEVAEQHLAAAAAAAPRHAAVLIGFYRFYFYKGRLREALAVADLCLEKACRDNRLPMDWRLVKAGDAKFDDYGDMLARFFTFALKGYAYLNLRLGDLVEGLAAVQKLLELDPSDKIGARVLLEVIERASQDDDG